MAAIVQYTDWLDEEVGNMAREGLRTLVVARKILSEDQYLDFEVNSAINIFAYVHIFALLPRADIMLQGWLFPTA